MERKRRYQREYYHLDVERSRKNQRKENSDLILYAGEQERKKDKMNGTGRYAYYRHGITPEERAALLNFQNNQCATCQRPLSTDTSKTYVDHDHVSGYVRGLLCQRCNPALGWYENNTDAIHDYISNSSARQMGLWVRKNEPTIPIFKEPRNNDPLPRKPKKTHCKNDHEFTEANTGKTSDGSRRCRTCTYERYLAKDILINPNRPRRGPRKP